MASSIKLPGNTSALRSSDVWDSCFDLDDAASLDRLVERARDSSTKSFFVNFSQSIAVCAYDLPARSVEAFLETPKSEERSTRWINIWSPSHQRPLLEVLAGRYNFSPRLLALMCSDPHEPQISDTSSRRDQPSQRSLWQRRRRHQTSATDSEKGFVVDESAENASISNDVHSPHGNLYHIVDNLWHYCSVDFGRSYMCIGYNSLYSTKGTGDHRPDSPLPHCIRVWTWLILCEDNTVISITEDLFADRATAQLSTVQERILAETRRTTVNVFRSLSLVTIRSLATTDPLKLLPIRRGLDKTPEKTSSDMSDTPSLLFYYLFENWHNSYTLVTRRESRFGVELSALRAEMFDRPRLHHIDRLDRIGKELGVLRRHFEAHTRIIERVVEPHGSPASKLRAVRIVSELDRDSSPSGALHDEVQSAVMVTAADQGASGVWLSGAAKARFKRLRDLIDVYALSEVEEYIKQKDALVAMNFNLIAIKQSTDVERLTRITLLLTKITILFTPISFMTAYFSTQLNNVQYTLLEYWVSFAVLLVLSWLSLLILGVFSGSVQTFEVLRGTWNGVQRAFKRVTASLWH